MRGRNAKGHRKETKRLSWSERERKGNIEIRKMLKGKTEYG